LAVVLPLEPEDVPELVLAELPDEPLEAEEPESPLLDSEALPELNLPLLKEPLLGSYILQLEEMRSCGQ
jgi:hypothetical protein